MSSLKLSLCAATFQDRLYADNGQVQCLWVQRLTQHHEGACDPSSPHAQHSTSVCLPTPLRTASPHICPGLQLQSSQEVAAAQV